MTIAVLLVVAITAVLTATSRASGQGAASSPRDQRFPAGFRALDADFWSGPWVFRESGSSAVVLPALRNSMGQRSNGPVPIRLDDGSIGTLRIESKPCTSTENCEPFDCGCPLEYESYWIEVADARAKRVARMHLWAAYGVFDIVAVDLIDGPGDELVIVRVPSHASPPIGHDLKLWKVGPTMPVELTQPISLAGIFGTQLIGCARWRTHLFVDLSESKPRTVALRSEFAATVAGFPATAVCRLEAQESSRVAILRRGQELRKESGAYRLR
jgi:hypothetical protein